MTTKQTQVNIRELVLKGLLQIMEQGELKNPVMNQILTNYQYLDKKDRAFFQRLCDGVIERALELDYIIDQFSKVKTEKMKPVIRNILRMAVYQIKYMDQVPDRAACNEAVSLAVKKGFRNLKGYVNGVLRTILREYDSISYPDKEKEPERYLSVIYSMPLWLVKNWIKEYGYEKTELMISSFLEKKKTTIRWNENQIPKELLKKQLEKQGIKVSEGIYLPYAMQIESYDTLQRIPQFLQGDFTVQDESSMLAVEAIGVKAGDVVIDVASAPGGKSTLIAEKLKNTGRVIARDLSETKVRQMEETIKRLRLNNIEIQVWDGRILRESDRNTADAVLADLPCSGLGVIGKKTDIKYNVSPEGIKSLVSLQRSILEVIWQYVKPGGILLYSTCTIQKEENMENVNWFLENFPFYLESIEPFIPKELWRESTKKGYLQLLPGVDRTDGFFLARMRRKNENRA